MILNLTPGVYWGFIRVCVKVISVETKWGEQQSYYLQLPLDIVLDVLVNFKH
jgi:hypothetical protein